MNKLIKKFLVLSSLVLSSNLSCSAATVTANFPVSAIYPPVCTLYPILSASFGAYDGKTTLSRTLTGTFTCTKTIVATISLSAGNGTYSNRKMTSIATGDSINYNLYNSGSYTAVVGDSTNSTVQLVSPASTGNPQAYVIYARLLAGQTPTPGTYTDTIVVTLSY